MTEVQDRLKMSDGFGLFFRHWSGTGEGERLLVCVHGAGRNSEYFGVLGEALAQEGIEVYAPDLRGFGNSVEAGMSRGDVRDPKRHLQDLVEVVGSLRYLHPSKKVFMLGHSEGGNYALWYAANHAETLAGAILAAPPISSSLKPPLSVMAKGVLAMIFAPKTLQPSAPLFPETERRTPEFQFWTQDQLDAHAISARCAVRVWRPLDNEALANAQRVSVPTLLIQGESDTLVLPEGARRLLGSLGARDKTLKTFPDTNHWFYHTVFPRSNFHDDPAKQRQVSDAISGWMKAR